MPCRHNLTSSRRLLNNQYIDVKLIMQGHLCSGTALYQSVEKCSICPTRSSSQCPQVSVYVYGTSEYCIAYVWKNLSMMIINTVLCIVKKGILRMDNFLYMLCVLSLYENKVHRKNTFASSLDPRMSSYMQMFAFEIGVLPSCTKFYCYKYFSFTVYCMFQILFATCNRRL